jgi:hypothetical protein
MRRFQTGSIFDFGQDELILADPAIASPLKHTAAAQLPVMGYANLQAWFARVQALDTWKKSGSTPQVCSINLRSTPGRDAAEGRHSSLPQRTFGVRTETV